MAQKILIMGESGTGKSTSLRNCDPTKTAVVNPVGKPLPFRGSGKFAMLNNVTDSGKITKWVKEQAKAGKKLIIVDDFQYVLAVPYMGRIKESGWEKYNDFGANYFDIIQVANELPDDVVVVYMTHLETLDDGLTTVKLIGKLLREKITIEGLFTVVLKTTINEGKYYFITQNSGKDTVKSPMGMFPSYAIDNDLAYVYEKIRNYYEVGDYRSDSEMAVADEAAATEVRKPETVSERRARRTARTEPAAPAAEQTPAEPAEPVQTETPARRSHDEVMKANQDKMNAYMEEKQKVVDAIANGRTEIPYDEVVAATASIPVPELEKVPRRTRKERTITPAQTVAEPATAPAQTVAEPATAPAGGRVRRTRRTRITE